MNTSIRFVVHAVKWRDRRYGNTYHSVRVYRTDTGEVLAVPMQYGYEDQYRQTALGAMRRRGWITPPPGEHLVDGDYATLWIVADGKKQECVNHGQLSLE